MLKEKFLQYLRAERHYSVLTVKSYDYGISEFEKFVENDREKVDWGTVAGLPLRHLPLKMLLCSYISADTSFFVAASHFIKAPSTGFSSRVASG